MPYISIDLKPKCERLVSQALLLEDEDAVVFIDKYSGSRGERNYSWCRWMIRKSPKGYTQNANLLELILQNAVHIGDAFCACAEYYRRVMVPYEQKKIAENGDVEGFPPETA